MKNLGWLCQQTWLASPNFSAITHPQTDCTWSGPWYFLCSQILKAGFIFFIFFFCSNVPKSPIREILELEPETAQFGKPEKLADGRRVRCTLEIIGKGVFKGIGRSYRIAKCTAAKCALRAIKTSKGQSS